MKQIAAKLMYMLIAASALCGAPLHAATYKWVDAEGRVHYSQTPPATEDFQRLRDPHPPQDPPVTEPAERAPAAPPPRAETSRAETPQETPEAFCNTAKTRLAALQDEKNIGRLVVKQDDGSMHKLSEEERLNYIEETTAQIEQHCP